MISLLIVAYVTFSLWYVLCKLQKLGEEIRDLQETDKPCEKWGCELRKPKKIRPYRGRKRPVRTTKKERE